MVVQGGVRFLMSEVPLYVHPKHRPQPPRASAGFRLAPLGSSSLSPGHTEASDSRIPAPSFVQPPHACSLETIEFSI